MKRTVKELILFLQEKGLSQKIIAQKVGVTQPTISRLSRDIHSDTNSKTKEKLEKVVFEFTVIEKNKINNE